MDAGQFQLLPIDQVALDPTNPRIRRFLEFLVGEPTFDNFALALDVTSGAADEQDAGTTAEKLRNSILANGGILQPIIVRKLEQDRYLCIEGNTRLYLYRSFVNDQVPGNWTNIPALVHEQIEQTDVDTIRLQAHLVGPRQWDAYSKAKYLWELCHRERMPIDRIIAICGGSRREVVRSIQAYADMETYFRPLFEPGETYDTERYSGFVELQASKVKDTILRNGFNLADFGKWMKAGKFKGLASVRQLPRVLSDKKARDVFIKKDIKAAQDVLEKPELSAGLKSATVAQLARALAERVGALPFQELTRLRDNPDDDTVRYVADALDELQRLITFLGRND
jgi:ParB-like nuclease domain